MKGWRVLDATGFEGTVGASRGRITLISEGDPPRTVPAEEIAILIVGARTTITSAALHYLTKHDIAMLSADWRGVPFAGLYPWGEHSRVAARHLAQAELTLPRRKNAWMRIVRAKIRGQASTLKPHDLPGAQRLDAIAQRVRSGDPANEEATAAHLYWPRLFSPRVRFSRDQLSGDLANAALNYGYMVLRGHGIRAVLGAGLSPPLGLFHRGRSNYFNLVDDLIEPFRPAIDHVVAGLPSEATLDDPHVKQRLVHAANQQFSDEGYRIPAVLDAFAQQLGRYAEGEVERLTVPSWSGPKSVPEAAVDGEE